MTFEPDPADLALSSIPGHETFDPRRHRFSEEELKPQPIMKKARKVQVPEEQKVSMARCRAGLWSAPDYSEFGEASWPIDAASSLGSWDTLCPERNEDGVIVDSNHPEAPVEWGSSSKRLCCQLQLSLISCQPAEQLARLELVSGFHTETASLGCRHGSRKSFLNSHVLSCGHFSSK